MKKSLRLTMIAILAMVCNVAFADAYKVLTFPDDGGEGKEISSYTASWNAKKGNDTWIIKNFNSNKWDDNWKYVKCGRNDNSSIASITTGFAIDKKITKVVVTIDAIIDVSLVNKISLTAASDAAFGDILAFTSVSSVNTGEIVLTLDEKDGNQPCPNLYYRLDFDCAAGPADGIIQISKIQYFEEDNGNTSIDAVYKKTEDAAIFNLNGQRLHHLNKGINIVNGKKVLIK